MIITRTPYRLSFFGGGTDYPVWFREKGGLVIASAMEHHCYISLRPLPPFFPHKSRVVYSEVETVEDHSCIKHPSVKGCLQYLKIEEGLEIHHDGDLPARSGIGSSSSFSVGMLHALHALKNRMATKECLAEQSIEVEQVLLHESVGVQDQIMASYGGFQLIHLGPGPGWRVESLILPPDYRRSLEKYVLLGFTGQTRIANDHAKRKIMKIESGETTSRMEEIHSIAQEARQLFVRQADFDAVGALLDRSWQAKRALSDTVANALIDDIYSTGIREGAFGGKIMGAGGGGFFFFLAPPSRHERIRAALPQVKVWVPFKVDYSGSRVIHHDAN